MTREEFDKLKPGDIIGCKNLAEEKFISIWVILYSDEFDGHIEHRIQCIWTSLADNTSYSTKILGYGLARFPRNWHSVCNE